MGVMAVHGRTGINLTVVALALLSTSLAAGVGAGCNAVIFDMAGSCPPSGTSLERSAAFVPAGTPGGLKLPGSGSTMGRRGLGGGAELGVNLCAGRRAHLLGCSMLLTGHEVQANSGPQWRAGGGSRRAWDTKLGASTINGFFTVSVGRVGRFHVEPLCLHPVMHDEACLGTNAPNLSAQKGFSDPEEDGDLTGGGDVEFSETEGLTVRIADCKMPTKR